ncbi:hypothetical protein G4B88_007692 [Cannabis sativa]|uniref:Defensin-like domain-containing protein n=1 Tax=Cannabis sativa TaxID=3483 RepID=A0A7J6HEC9_CANSA|nr:hypothetical protein G4B88_007692 [Cannabis sativa]
MAALQKFLMLFLIATALVSIQLHSSNGEDVHPKGPVDPFCYVPCSVIFGDKECSSYCIKKKFRTGICMHQDLFLSTPNADLMCCCSP